MKANEEGRNIGIVITKKDGEFVGAGGLHSMDKRSPNSVYGLKNPRTENG